MMRRAYSIIEIKSVDEEQRIIEGMASTPSVDRMGDIVEPDGATFALPLPLLWQHQSKSPVGHVTAAKPGPGGIPITARIAKIAEPGALKDMVDMAWQAVKAGLVRGLSIGFSPKEYAFTENGIRFITWDWLELSLVTIPANSDASISTIKSIDASFLRDLDPAATGTRARSLPTTPAPREVISLNPRKGSDMSKLSEQIAGFEAKRAASFAAMEKMMDEAQADGERTLTADEAKQYADLDNEVKLVDEHLVRLRDMQKRQGQAAAAVVVDDPAKAATARAPATVRSVRKSEPGIAFARVVKCLGLAKGNVDVALHMAEARYKDDQAVIEVLKSSVAAGSIIGGSGSLGNIVGSETSVFADFVEYLRPQTILGKFGAGGIPSLRRVPFRTALISQTGGGNGYWVGEGKPKPLTGFSFDRTTLTPCKVANIAVATMESLRDSSPSAETMLRDSLAAALRQTMDEDFIDPSNSGSANVKPASITNGLSAHTSSGNTADDVRADIKTLFSDFIAANNAPTSGVWIMPATTALGLSLMVNELGARVFPSVTMNGGTFEGLPVITSESVPSVTAGATVVLVNAGDIWFADDGDIAVDMSMEASLEMDDSPSHDSVTPTPSQLVSLWQTNSVGFRAERTLNWKLRRASAVSLLDQVNWGSGS